jgi:hypothetical protein
MLFTANHPDIIHATGNHWYSEYVISGDDTQPVHLNLWFRRRAKGSIQQLIKELEALAAATDQGPSP